MVGHIYGRVNVLNTIDRSHMFINELKMYIEYLKGEMDKNLHTLNEKQAKYFAGFKTNLLQGISYYKNLLPNMSEEAEEMKQRMLEELEALKMRLNISQEVFA